MEKVFKRGQKVVEWNDAVVYKTYCNDNLETLPVEILKQMKRHIQDVIDHKQSSLMNLPIGTRFYVVNGCWKGRIVLYNGEKHIYVEATKTMFALTKSYAKSVTIRILEEQRGRIDMKCDFCNNVATHYAKSGDGLVFKCEDCLKDMSIAKHDHLSWEYIQKSFYGGK